MKQLFCVFLLSMLVCTLAQPGCAQQEQPAFAGVLSGTELCTALDPLAAWMGATCTWTPKKTGVKVAIGPKALTLQPDAVVAQNAKGRPFCLPVPPFWQNGQLYVPVRAVVDTLGGIYAAQETGAVLLTCQGKTTQVLPPLPPAAPAPTDGVLRLLNDPRLPVDALAKTTGLTTQIRPYLEGFVRIAKPVQPALKGIANSKPLRLLTHVPVVGSLIGVCQDAIGAINSTIGMAQKLVELDKQYLVPIREAFVAVQAVTATPDAATIAAAQPWWTAALAAAEKQRALNETAGKHVQGLLAKLNLVEMKMAEYRKAYPRSKYILTLGPLLRATQDLNVTIEAHRWQMATMKDYFTALTTATAPVQ